MVWKKFPVLQTGKCNKAPAEVLMASSLTVTEFFSGIITPANPAACAVLAIAPKFLTSVILSNAIKQGSLSFSINCLANSSAT